jgi:hypothetical protein
MAAPRELPPLPAPAVTFHLAPAPAGDDAHTGDADRPFATLTRARDAIREIMRQGSLPPGGVNVVVHGGEYRVDTTWKLEAEDSGSADAPVVYRAADGQTPRFRGGLRLTGFGPVTDPALRERLPEAAREQVFQVDLRAAGVTNLLPLKLGGFGSGHGFTTHPAHELFFNGRALPLVRGPNEGFLRIEDVLVKDGTRGYDREGSKVGRFRYEGDRPARWVNEPDLLLYGYWFWDWADSYERVVSIDPAAHTITLAEPFHRYGYSIGAPFYAVNALSELDQPGEWYLDRAGGRLLLWPPEDPASATVELSTFPGPMVRFEGVSHVRLQGLTWELGSGDGLQIHGGTNCLLAGVTVRRFAGNGVIIRGGTGHGLLSCDLHSFGRGAVVLASGDRRTLSGGGHWVENCELHELSRIDRTYTPAIHVSGVGHEIRHNRMHDIPSSALRVDGNEHRIEYNEIFRVVRESDDQGGADMWGNPTYRGNVYRFNYWHHIDAPTAPGARRHGFAGIRLDDAISGTLVYGNVFYRVGGGTHGFGAVQIHGGKENRIENNLFVDCPAAVSFTPWRAERWREFVKEALADPAIDRTLYLERYPALDQLAANANVNELRNNVAVRCGELSRRDPGVNVLTGNHQTGASLRWTEDGQLAADVPDFAPIPFASIGLYRDEFRRRAPEVTPPGVSR